MAFRLTHLMLARVLSSLALLSDPTQDVEILVLRHEAPYLDDAIHARR